MLPVRSGFVLGLLTLAAASSLLACSDEENAPVAEDVMDFVTGPKLAFDEYDVLFTNPVCARYEYATPVASVGGDMLTAKPENVYCKRGDGAASAARESSPQKKLVDWIVKMG